MLNKNAINFFLKLSKQCKIEISSKMAEAQLYI